MRRYAFTLIELLVVVSIIALLIAILLPALRKARQTAWISVCASNMHQLHIATYAYANDSAGKVPQVGGTEVRIDKWHKDFSDTLRNRYLAGNFQVMSCPTMPRLTEQQYLISATSDYRMGWYIATMHPGLDPDRSPVWITADLNGDGKMDNLSIQRITEPGYKVMFFDDDWLNGSGQWQVTTGIDFPEPGVPHVSDLDDPGHGAPPAGSNHAALDGSVAWHNFDQMLPVYTYSGTLVDANRDVWW